MRGVFDDEEPEPAAQRRDTELTLGAGALLVLFFALVLICGLCFGLGYAVGRRGSQDSALADPRAAGAQGTPQADFKRSKPSPSAHPNAPSSQTGAPDSQAAPEPDAGSHNSGPVAALAAPASPLSSAGQPQVRPALPVATNPPQPAASGAARVKPALAPAVPTMVQIAAIAHVEDAEVLVNALRRRGYAVTVRREDADNLIHVRIGPFANRGDAAAMQQKLLNDGYNAILQP
jgi:cell division septation protein DedD